MTHSPVNIISATLAGEYRIRILFDDQTEQVVDFKPFLAHSHHPAIRAYLDLTRFADFRLNFGELVWGEYELCFPIMDLYLNKIDHRELLAAPA